MAVICGMSNAAYMRLDGVYVVLLSAVFGGTHNALPVGHRKMLYLNLGLI